VKYHITYNIQPHPAGLTADEIPEGHGACDCLAVASIIGQPGGPGPLSVVFISANGLNGGQRDLTPEQQFQIWALWAEILISALPNGMRRGICSFASGAVEECFKVTSAGGGTP